MGNAIAGEKALQPNDAAAIRRPDQHRAADAALDQADPAQDQSAHDALAEIGLRHQERAQPIRRNQQRFDLALGVAVDQRDAARELADLADELPRPLIDHRGDVAEAIALGDRNMARQHHEQAGAGLAGFEQAFAIAEMARLAEPAHPRDLLRRQAREGLLETGKGPRRRDAAIGVCRHGGHGHLHPKSEQGSKHRPPAEPGHSPGFSPLPSFREANSP